MGSRVHIVLFCCLIQVSQLFAQEDRIVKSITLDSVVIEAVRTGLDVRNFIEIQKKDTTLHAAFRMLRRGNYSMDTRMVVFDRKANEKATQDRKCIHVCDSSGSGIKILDEKISGPLLDRKGRYRYYTSVLFEKAFFPELKSGTGNPDLSRRDESRSSADYGKLKDLVFSPGAAVDLPFIGKRLAIFDEDMAKYYDYAIRRDFTTDSIACFVFSCTAKVDSRGSSEDKPVVKKFETWFKQGSYEVLKRKTNYVYHGLLADLDIKIEIDLKPEEKKAVPFLITYSGYWDIPGRRAEIVWFKLSVNDYTECKN